MIQSHLQRPSVALTGTSGLIVQRRREIQSLIDNGTWELTKLPPGRKAVGFRRVVRIKRNPDGSIERYKGRVVAKGFSQQFGTDFTETLLAEVISSTPVHVSFHRHLISFHSVPLSVSIASL